jgi:Grx4 family monothiol glutaredoxin
VEDVAEQYNVTSVPTFVFLKDGKEIDRLTGADALLLAKKIENYSSSSDKETAAQAGTDKAASLLNQRLTKLVNYSPVMLFMKGTPNEPKCGFSRTIVDILKKHKVPFAAFDILTDEEVRQGLKDLSNWKTYPQLYVKGELIGGLDIVKELDEEGQLLDVVKPAIEAVDPKVVLNERIKKLINSSPVMLFMKGTPDEPKCGFSNQISSILNDQGIQYGSFNILSDNAVREGLKEYSNWPTYPQLYAHGELIGGLDIIKELVESGEFQDALAPKKN